MRGTTLVRAAGLAGAALAVGVWTSGGRGRELDERAFKALNADRGAATDVVLHGVTELGSIWASVGAATVLAAADRAGTRLLIGPPRATSWPSSHPAVLLAFTTAAGAALRAGPLARAGLDGLGLVVGVSRTHVGVHYPGDVVGGVLLGKAVGRAVAG